LHAETALFITFNEGGGYYDSGYIQPLDFFGDAPRIALIVVSPFSIGGHVSHSYTDHVSILKFIERNWKLKPLTKRSRDNFPNRSRNRTTPTCHSTAQLSAIFLICSSSKEVAVTTGLMANRPKATAIIANFPNAR